MNDVCLYPSRYNDGTAMERRCGQLKEMCLSCMEKLTPEEREWFAEYFALLEERENQRVMKAYNSGIQVGRQRERKRL